MNPIELGILLTYVFQIQDILNCIVHCVTQLDKTIVSYQRVSKILQISPEKFDGLSPDPKWGSQGKIEVRNLTV